MLAMDYFLIIFLIILVIISAIADLKTQKIPNFVTLPGMLIALAYHTALNGFDGLLFSAAGIVIGIALLIIPYLMGGMGAGDAKLMGAIGGVLGAKAVFYAFLLIAAVGGIYALILIVIYRKEFTGFFRKKYDNLVNHILTRKYIPDTEERSKNRPRLCYGLAIALGTVIYILLNTTGFQFF
jgi:prepilin peptidase CpaA